MLKVKLFDSMAKWEYRQFVLSRGSKGLGGLTLEFDKLDEINKLGEEGWEMVGVVPIHITGVSHVTHIVLFFKRRKK